MPYKIALAGNPNCGKTTLFNLLTGSSQYVGNFPGATVEKKSGRSDVMGTLAVVTDLPGIYSLAPYTPEEVAAREYILNEKPDLIVNVADGSCLERSLYLTVQIAELGRPVILALNMADMLAKRGIRIDLKKFTGITGIPAVAVSAARKEGVGRLVKEMASSLKGGEGRTKDYGITKNLYPWEINSAVAEIESIISPIYKEYSEFAAVKLFENDKIYRRRLDSDTGIKRSVDRVLSCVNAADADRQLMTAQCRYKRAREVAGACVFKTARREGKSPTEKIDGVLLDRFLAFPILLLITAAVFILTFGSAGGTLSDLCGRAVEAASQRLEAFLTGAGAAAWTVSLVCDGIVSGVGSVLSFIPQMTVLFLLLSVMEDSGYMARAAFLTDRLFRPVGLSGQSFVPMFMGFGCTVPAVMAARTLGSDRVRKATVFVVPFMSCSAKMPVYAMLISRFFGRYGFAVIGGVYLLGAVTAAAAAAVVTGFGGRKDGSQFLLEMPEYRMPTVKGLAIHVWQRIKGFINKAGTVLLLAGIIVWFLRSFDPRMRFIADDAGQSILAHIGRFAAPVFRPLGFGSWQISAALLSGLIAKEAVVSSVSIACPSGITGLLSPASALSLAVFVLFYTPCVTAVAAIYRELQSFKLTALAVLSYSGFAWVMSFAVYLAAGLFF